MDALRVEAVAGVHPHGRLEAMHAALRAGRQPYRERGMAPCPPETFAALPACGIPPRRTPRLARLAFAAALEVPALRSAGAGAFAESALVVATAYGSVRCTFDFLDSLLADGAELASPTAFSHSVTNMTAALLGRHFGVLGPSLTVTDAGGSAFSGALAAAAGMLAGGRAERVLLWAVEEREALMDDILERGAGKPAAPEGAVFFLLRQAKDGETPCPMVRDGTLDPERNARLEGVFGPGSLLPAWDAAVAVLEGSAL